MVNTTSDTWDTLFKTLQKNYSNIAPGEALFWKRWRGGSQYDYGLRVECPTLMKEFTNGVNLGADPEGFLFYESSKDIDDVDVYYNITYSTTTTTKEKAVLVQFWHTEDGGATEDPGSYFAQFLAKDPNSVVDYTLTGQKGNWHDLKTGTASAHVKKYSQKDQVVVTIPSLRKKAVFNVKDNKDKPAVDVWGNLSFTDINNLATSSSDSYADYNADRIIFYPQSGWTGSANFTAFFIPLDSAPSDSLGGLTFEANTVKWSQYDP